METGWLLEYSPVVLALYATLFTWAFTALGASTVFFFRSINAKVLNMMLGFAAGVMIAASFWSLLDPAITMSDAQGKRGWLIAATGFLAGGAFLWLVDRTLPHLHKRFPVETEEGIRTSWGRSVLLVLAVTLHNVPEGMAVGIAFGALACSPDPGLLGGAIALAIGMAIQNLPEGAAISIPLRREGFSRFRSFWYGQLSGVVEPIAGVAGAYLVMTVTPLLPYALSFAAGAMIYVVVEELIPESQSGNETDLSTVGAMLGFAVMMVLDVALG